LVWRGRRNQDGYFPQFGVKVLQERPQAGHQTETEPNHLETRVNTIRN
jgi:hypothetical protein